MGMKKKEKKKINEKTLWIGFTSVEEKEHVGCVPKMVKTGLRMGKKSVWRNWKYKRKILITRPPFLWGMAQDVNIYKHSGIFKNSEYKGEGN